MPIIVVKNYTWRQTEDKVIIRVPLPSKNCSKADVFTSSSYLKVHSAPFLFEVFLSAPINELESKYTATENEIVFELQKLETNTWSSLEAELTKSEKQNLRLKIIEQTHKDVKEKSEKKQAKKTEIHRQAVREQIVIDSQLLKRIDDIKNTEKQKAMQELDEWKNRQQSDRKDGIYSSSNKDTKALQVMNRVTTGASTRGQKHRTTEDIFSDPMPLPRQTGTIQINFTSRAFPTPSRESRQEEEEEWLKNLAEARRKIGFVPEDLSPEERDPVWLKEKGDSFFSVGNYHGAISAYSYAIKLGSKMPALYSNRAAAQMALENFNKCVEDCSAALDLLKPPCSLNVVQRARCFARRGTALCKLGLMAEGINELKAAVSLQSDDQKLMMDLEKAIAMVYNPPNLDEELE